LVVDFAFELRMILHPELLWFYLPYRPCCCLKSL
jgi:hypothetical protein